MSIFLKDQWKDWARNWGLTHGPEKGWIHRSEHVVGERNGFLVHVAWGKDEAPGLIVCIRFPAVADPQRLRQALIDDTTLDTLPGKGNARRKMFIESRSRKVIHIGETPEFTLSENSLVWRRTFSFRTPRSADVPSWVDTLIQAIARVTPAFDGRCETCPTGTVQKYVLVNQLPMMICVSCQQRLRSEGEMAERTYEMTETRHLAGIGLACVAVVVGALGWSALAVFTERTFAVLGIGIGALVAWCYRMGAGRVDVTGRGIAACLTIASVVAGQVLLYTWWVAQRQPDLGFDLDAGLFVYIRSWAQNPGQEAIGLLFGIGGAWMAIQALARPQLKPTIATAGESEERKAA